MTLYANHDKYMLKSPVRVNDLEIVSGKFKYIKPSNVSGEFIATVESDNNRIIYETSSGDINESGTWKIWAEYTDDSGRTSRARTSNITFEKSNV